MKPASKRWRIGAATALPGFHPVLGRVLAGSVGRDHALVRRLRTVTFGLLTPFYFIRAGSFVSISALVAASCWSAAVCAVIREPTIAVTGVRSS